MTLIFIQDNIKNAIDASIHEVIGKSEYKFLKVKIQDIIRITINKDNIFLFHLYFIDAKFLIDHIIITITAECNQIK
jgi:hypothetical protein